MPKRAKTRQSLEVILASCSDTLFPAEMGRAAVHINSKDVEGDTPLHVMVWREDVYAISVLIEAGANVNAQGDMTETPLHIATRKANSDIVCMLLDAGANADLISEFGETPRLRAAEMGGEIQKLFR